MPKRLITHSEDFHTDDVFATALLLSIFPDAQVVRSRDADVLATGDIVYDVGRVYDPAAGRFDHHQLGSTVRPSGITYSAFGLLWKEYGLQYCNNDTALFAMIDKKLVEPIDATDNGQQLIDPKIEDVRPFVIEDIISQLNPLEWVTTDESYDGQFQKAVTFATAILERTRQACQDKLLAKAYVLERYREAEDKRMIVLDRHASITECITLCPELLYVVSPRADGTWGILAVSVAPGSFECRQPFPKSWRGQSADKLSALTGVDDLTFCHTTGFYAAAKTKQGAIAVARRALG